MKNLISLLLICLVSVIVVSPLARASEQNKICAVINGSELNDVININGTAMVPVKGISYALGFKDDYSPETKLITMSKKGLIIIFSLNIKHAKIYKTNNLELVPDNYLLTQEPILISDEVYIPLRFIAEITNAKVFSSSVNCFFIETITPTILLPGYNHTEATFNTMVENYKELNPNIGRLTMDGKENIVYSNLADFPNFYDPHPLIVFRFLDNAASLDQQVKWMNSMINVVNEYYGARQVNVIAHSMGGLVATKYILDATSQHYKVRINKLVTLDSPIKGAKAPKFKPTFSKLLPGAVQDLTLSTPAIQNLLANKANFDHKVESSFSLNKGATDSTSYYVTITKTYPHVLSIANTEDEVVSVESAQGLAEFTENITLPEPMRLSGILNGQSSHSYVHSDLEVIKQVKEFLFSGASSNYSILITQVSGI
jgi:uncharacterized alpha/beta hydrolase family protein